MCSIANQWWAIWRGPNVTIAGLIWGPLGSVSGVAALGCPLGMKSPRLVREWKSATLSLLGRVPGLVRACRRHASAKAVHDLRVTLRRLRLLLRLGRSLVDEGAVAAFVAWSRRTCEAAGPLRDDDVVLEWLAGKGEMGKGPVTDAIQGHRDRAAAGFRRRLRPGPGGMGRRVNRVAEGRKEETRLRKRLVKRLGSWREVLRGQGPRFFRLSEEAQHEVRRRLRQWRYARELEGRWGREAGDPTLKGLLRLQEAMGEWQNLKLVERRLGGAGAGLRKGLRASWRRELAGWRGRVRKRLGRAVS